MLREAKKKSPLFYLAPNEIFILFNELFILILNIKKKIPKFSTYFNETAPFVPGDVSGRQRFFAPRRRRRQTDVSAFGEKKNNKKKKTGRLRGGGDSPITTVLRSFFFFFLRVKPNVKPFPTDSQSGVGAGSNN